MESDFMLKENTHFPSVRTVCHDMKQFAENTLSKLITIWFTAGCKSIKLMYQINNLTMQVSYLFRQHRQQQQMTQTVHTTNMTTLPTAMEMAAVTPSDKNLLMMLSSVMIKLKSEKICTRGKIC